MDFYNTTILVLEGKGYFFGTIIGKGLKNPNLFMCLIWR